MLLDDVEATLALGRDLADVLVGGSVIALSGNLGAGKTTFVQAVGKALGIREVISSPTFTMMNEYHSGRLSLYHLDFYRVMEMAERQQDNLSLDLVATEFDEICESKRAVLVLEWPEYFLVDGKNYLDGVDHLYMSLKMNDGPDARDHQRILIINAFGVRAGEQLAKLSAGRATLSEYT
jgi:tRNA threonylcarbamoyladenosine biosynthesis protein TsaE